MDAAALSLNYADSKRANLGRVDQSFYRNLLCSVGNRVLFVGEGNFSFTVAFAAMRKKESGEEDIWGGILATRFEDVGFDYPPVALSQAKIECVESVLKNYKKGGVRGDPQKAMEKIQAVSCLPELKPTEEWLYGIDARALKSELINRFTIIWFQCPWANSVGQLILDFLLNMVRVDLNSGCFVCIGITKKFPYIKNYYLENILGRGLSCDGTTEVLKKYDFMGADDTFIKEIISYGYRHQGLRDIHDDIFDHHVTLVFKKKQPEATQNKKRSSSSHMESERPQKKNQ